MFLNCSTDFLGFLLMTTPVHVVWKRLKAMDYVNFEDGHVSHIPFFPRFSKIGWQRKWHLREVEMLFKLIGKIVVLPTICLGTAYLNNVFGHAEPSGFIGAHAHIYHTSFDPVSVLSSFQKDAHARGIWVFYRYPKSASTHALEGNFIFKEEVSPGVAAATALETFLNDAMQGHARVFAASVVMYKEKKVVLTMNVTGEQTWKQRKVLMRPWSN